MKDAQPHPYARRLKWLGLALAIVCCYFVWRAVQDQAAAILPHLSSPGFAIAFIGSALLWIILNAVLGLIWRFLLQLSGETISAADSARIAMQTQIAKYLPGNVFHFAGRIALASRMGISKRKAALATLLEALILIASAAAISARLLLSFAWSGWLALAVAVAIGSGVFAMRRRIGESMHSFGAQAARAAAPLLALGLLIFAIQATMFAWIDNVIYPEASVGPIGRIEIVSASWLAGFVTIGSPGGIGIRELAISFFATSQDEGERLIAVAAVTRLCSIAGDVGSFFIATLINGRTKTK